MPYNLLRMDSIKRIILGRYSLKDVSLNVLIIVPTSASLTYQGKNRQDKTLTKINEKNILY